MEQFTERLSRLAELSPEELDSLEQELVVAFDAADEAADLDGMQSMADAIEAVRAEKEAKNPAEEVPADVPAEDVVEEIPAELAASATDEESPAVEPASDENSKPAVTADATTEETIVDETPSTDETAEEVVATDAEEVEATEAPAEAPAESTEEVVETEADAAAETEAVVAEADAGEEIADSTDQPTTAEADPADANPEATEVAEESEEQVATEITADDVPEVNQPVAAAAPKYTIRAGGDIPGITAGAQLDDMDSVVEAMTKKVNAMRGVGGDGEHIVVASFAYEDAVSEERTLKPGDLNGNAKKIRNFLSEPEALTRDALIAGAWCAPRTPIYDVPTMGTTTRPVRDALPSFNAERGGITWIAPPGLPDLASATSLWRYDGTNWLSYSNAAGTTQTNPTATKPCVTIPCGPEKTADVDAIPVCFCFDNLGARAFPEWVRGNTELVLVGQARFAEQVLLSKMYAVAATGSSCGTPATQVGAARDFVLTVQTAAAAARWRLRLAPNAPLQLLAPAWVATAIAVDLGLQQPGDNTFVTATESIDGFFREFGVDPIWHFDDVPGGAGAFTGCSFPSAADWLLFPTGSFLRLDTGELNLGVVRTKEDVQKNKYCEFSETFETVAYVGPESPDGWITKGVTQIDLAGSSGAARAITIS